MPAIKRCLPCLTRFANRKSTHEEIEMNITRLEPYGLLDLLNRDRSRLDYRLFNQPQQRNTRATSWVPAVDIVEEEGCFLLRADLPGVTPENIDLRTEKGRLTLSGERTIDSKESANALQKGERVSGKFERRFSLPETADTDGICANCHNGILEVTIPKLPEVQQRRITVKAA
jgi:HSP20 family protein